MRRPWVVAFAVVLVAGCSAAPSPSSPSSAPDLVAARIAAGLPDCPETDLSTEAVPEGLPKTALACLGGGRTVNLAGLPRVNTVVNVWAQWCGPCREESPYLAEAVKTLGDKVSFIGINYVDPQEALAIEFAGLVGWRYPHVADPERSLQAPLRIAGLPMTLFVGPDGRVVGRHVGVLTSTGQLMGLVKEQLGVS